MLYWEMNPHDNPATFMVSTDPNMTLCSICQAIDIPNLPLFTGLDQMLDQGPGTPIGQPHHNFRSLRESAPSCPLCALLFHWFMETATKQVRGAIEYGPDRKPKLDSIPSDEDSIVLLALSRNCRDETEKHIYGFQAVCDTIRCNFSLFAIEDTAAALTNTIVGRIPKPIDQCDRPLEWLRTCIVNHSQCTSYEKIVKGEISFPTRVLDVGDSSNPQTLRIVDGAGLIGRYIALSHCWGKNPLIKTTKSSLGFFREQIDPKTLTKTFLDAVMITRKLGVRYLWIDSLCIIQDDNEDWERGATSIAQVYSQSLVTLAASAASDGSQGFLRIDQKNSMIEISYPSGNTHVHSIFVGRPFNRFQSLTSEPLNTRAWTLQERVLSPRILHYGRDQLYWECRKSIISESGNPPYNLRLNQSEDESYHDGWLSRISSDLMPKVQEDGKMTLLEHEENYFMGDYDGWYGLVQEYTERDLSYGDDKLPALSGLAKAYSIQYGGTYVAGLWSEDLFYGLLWFTKTTQPLRRPATYRAPSWSWASVDGPISYFTINAGQIPDQLIEIEDIIYWTSLAGSDPFGKIKDCGLKLTGYVKQARIKTVLMDVVKDVEIDGKLLGEGDSVQLLFDDISAIGDATLDSITPDREIFCLLMASSYLQYSMEVDQAIMLLLAPTEEENHYTRIGFAGMYKAREYKPEATLSPYVTVPTRPGDHGGDEDSLVGWFDDATRSTITIV